MPPGDPRELQLLTMTSDTEMSDQQGGYGPMTCGDRLKAEVKKNGLILCTLAGVVLGVALGFALRELNPSDDVLMWLGLPGDLFMRSLKATIVPLVVSMVIGCTATLDPKSNGKIAIVGTLGFLVTQLITSTVAVCLFFIFTPDTRSVTGGSEEFGTDLETQDVLADLIRNVFPDNIVSATFTQTSTVYETSKKTVHVPDAVNPNMTRNMTRYSRERGLGSSGGTNIIGLITISAVTGIACSRVLKPDCEFLNFFKQVEKVVIVLIGWLFWTTPVGVLSLILVSIADVDDISDVFYRLAMLVASVCIGLSVYTFVIIPILLGVIRRCNPFAFLISCIRPFVIGFATTGTSVAIPDMLTTCEKNKVDPAVSAFVIPMSVNLHADGSALYITAACLFVGEASGMVLRGKSIFITCIMSAILSLAIPPVPSASIVTVVIILTSLNYPLEDVALLFAVEWLLDRCRSGVNAIGHVMVAAITDSICRKALSMDTSKSTLEVKDEEEKNPANQMNGDGGVTHL